MNDFVGSRNMRDDDVEMVDISQNARKNVLNLYHL